MNKKENQNIGKQKTQKPMVHDTVKSKDRFTEGQISFFPLRDENRPTVRIQLTNEQLSLS